MSKSMQLLSFTLSERVSNGAALPFQLGGSGHRAHQHYQHLLDWSKCGSKLADA